MHISAYFATLILAVFPTAMADFKNYSCCGLKDGKVTGPSGYTQTCCNVEHGEIYITGGVVRKSIALIILSPLFSAPRPIQATLQLAVSTGGRGLANIRSAKGNVSKATNVRSRRGKYNKGRKCFA